jgi:deoxyhypusine synthase
MGTRHPCQAETSGQHNQSADPRRGLTVKRVDECETLDELFQNCLPAFGGRYLRRIYDSDQAIGAGNPITMASRDPLLFRVNITLG